MKNNYSPLTVYIPISFPDIDELVIGTKLKPDKIRVLLHQMYLSKLSQTGYSNTAKAHRFNYIFHDGYVALHSALLINLLSKRYTKYLHFLEEKKLVTVRISYNGTPAYTPGDTSKHYKIANELLHAVSSARHFRKEVITDHSTIKAALNARDNHKYLHGVKSLREVDMEPIHKHLLEMELSVRFNIPAAEEWIKRVQDGTITDHQLTTEDLERVGMELELANSINEGISFNYKVDQFGERFYTPLKRVVRYMRQFMYFENIPNIELACLDISNSQLYFSTLLIKKNIVETIIPEFLPIINTLNKGYDKPDFKRYIDACVGGIIYTEWQKSAGLETRDKAKKELIQVLFSHNIAKMPSIKVFRDSFPSVAKYFREIKGLKEDVLPFITKTYIDRNENFKSDPYHRNLSCAVQRLESRIFIKRIGQSLIDNGIKPFFTIHDSVYFPKELTEKVQQIITNEFQLLNVTPPKLKLSTP